MKLFVYKTLFVMICIYLLFQFTLGLKISHYEKILNNLNNDQGRELVRDKIRGEIKKATEKDQILKVEDRELLKKFIFKIQNELNN